jgi:hypothetical protein
VLTIFVESEVGPITSVTVSNQPTDGKPESVEGKTPQRNVKGKEKNPVPKNTGYENIIERNCQYLIFALTNPRITIYRSTLPLSFEVISTF